ncbi:MAG: PAS domain S-box protein [Syntrophales bacterium]|nr:PAS domain S-box protein [Syntrophales bacterium]
MKPIFGGHMVGPSKPNHRITKEITSLKKRIRELEETEKALRESEKKYRELFDFLPIALFEVDLQGTVLSANPAIFETFGYSRSDLEQGLNGIQMIAPDDQERLAGNIQRLLDGEWQAPSEYKGIRKDGSTFPLLIYPAVTRIGDEPLGIRGAIVDLTDRKRVEGALRESEEKYRALVETAAEAIFLAQDGAIAFCNKRFSDLTGYELKELTTDLFTALIHPEDRHMVYDRYVQRLEGKDVPPRYSFRFIDARGNTRWADMSVTLITWEGKPASLCIASDITDRKQTEAEKLELERRLAGAQKLKAIGTLAAGVAHDFNNLLTGIQSYASLIKLTLEPFHPHYEKLKHVEELVESGADLTKQLLGFARSGRYEVKPLSMSDIIRKTASMFGRTRKEITIREEYSHDPCIVEADHVQMEQVFMNLCVNAWHAMPGGGIIFLKTEQVVLDDTQAIYEGMAAGGYVKITVTDTGTGIDESTKAHIFDPFFTTKGMGRGTGLGLATAYGIIKGHGGMIHVDSSPGRGTTFTIHLPASEKEEAREAATDDIALRGSETILLVDDEKMVLDASMELLEFLGYRVYSAESGREAMDLYRRKQEEIDLVILDMIMPGLSGGATFDRLAQINPGVKVLLASGYTIEGEARKIMDRGCSGFIQKPFPLEKLSRRIRELLD